jgi:DNA-binding NarL/FixJ family response regulator
MNTHQTPSGISAKNNIESVSSAAPKAAESISHLTRVAIVEDAAAVRVNLARLIDAATGFSCVCACGSAEEALRRIPMAEPDVVLMDINLPRISGIECTAQLRRILPQVPILMLTMYNDHDRILEALRAGAVGYLLKRITPAELFAAIRDVRNGGAPMTAEVSRKLVESLHRTYAPSSSEALSPREVEIMKLVALGLANKEVAARLNISYDTVRAHLKNIFRKLDAQSRTEAVAKFLQQRPGG